MLQELLMQPTRWQELWEHPEMVVSPNGTIQVGQGYCKNNSQIQLHLLINALPIQIKY
jgi:hypothetical protein